jgi:hypothetical protein
VVGVGFDDHQPALGRHLLQVVDLGLRMLIERADPGI